MSTNNLNDYEKDLLLSLSYLDIPPQYVTNDEMTMEDLLKCMKDTDKNKINNNGQVEMNERYKRITEYLEKNQDSPLHDFKLVGYENSNCVYNSGEDNNTTGSRSGLVAYAFDNGHGDGVILYRGSESGGVGNTVADWGSNLSAGLGVVISQQKEALDFYDKYKNMFDETLAMGHSKGGNLTAYVYANRFYENLKAYCLNGQPINWDYLNEEQREALRGDNFTFNIIDGDFVNKIGYSLEYVDEIIKFKDGEYESFVSPHYEDNGSYDENYNHIIEENPYTNFKGQAILGELLNMAIYSFDMNRYDFIWDLYIKIIEAGEFEVKIVIDEIINEIKDSFTRNKEFLKLLKKYLNFLGENLFFKSSNNQNKFLGGKSGTVNETISVDTSRIAYYEDELTSIGVKIANLNQRINNLYFKVGFNGVDNILKADFMTHSKRDIDNIVKSLRAARNLLETTERKLYTKAQGIG